MSFKLEEIQPPISARITGLDLRKPLSAETADAIDEAISRYPLLVFPAQDIDDDQLLAFSENFGPVQVSVQYQTRKDDHRLQPKITDISNVGKEDETFKVGDRRRMNTFVSRRWHSDQAYQTVPARYSFLLSIPAVGGAGILEARKAFVELGSEAIPALTVGIGVAAVVGYATIAWFLRWLGAHQLVSFAVYRVVAGLALLGGLATRVLAP